MEPKGGEKPGTRTGAYEQTGSRLFSLSQLKERLEPAYQDLDYIIDTHIRPAVSAEQFTYFATCGFRAKALSDINTKVQELDAAYTNLLSRSLAEDRFQELPLKKVDDGYRYVPFYEALEFENLLGQAKALLDCFARAMGGLWGMSPAGIDKLIRVLSAQRGSDTAGRVLDLLREASKRLNGVVTDAGSREKKGIADLIAHGERADIFFTLVPERETGQYAISHGALLSVRHADSARFSQHRVVTVAEKVWLLLMGVVEKCFQVQFPGKNPDNGS